MTPINKRKKGLRSQNKCREWYESMGYEVEIRKYTPFQKNVDFFNLWDLICVSKKKRGDIVFCQVKTNRKPTTAWIKKAKKWGPRKIKKLYVVYKDYDKGIVPAIQEWL